MMPWCSDLRRLKRHSRSVFSCHISNFFRRLCAILNSIWRGRPRLFFVSAGFFMENNSSSLFQQYLETIGKSELFSGLPVDLCSEIIAHSQHRTFARDQFLLHQGDVPRYTAFILKGNLITLRSNAEGDETVIRLLGSGETCMEAILFPHNGPSPKCCVLMRRISPGYRSRTRSSPAIWSIFSRFIIAARCSRLMPSPFRMRRCALVSICSIVICYDGAVVQAEGHWFC